MALFWHRMLYSFCPYFLYVALPHTFLEVFFVIPLFYFLPKVISVSSLLISVAFLDDFVTSDSLGHRNTSNFSSFSHFVHARC